MFLDVNQLPNGKDGSRATSMAVLDGLLGGSDATRRVIGGGAWPGATSMTAGARRSGQVTAIGRAPGLPPGLPALTALLQAMQRSAEWSQIDAALKKFGLDRNDVTHLLSARAYVWGRNFAPLIFFSVPTSGPVNERVAQAIGRFERDNPGTLGLVTNGNANAAKAISAVVDAALAHDGVFAPIIEERRASSVDKALSTYSSRARAAVGLRRGNRSWVAHHLLTFAGVAKLPATTQKAMAASGWKLDAAENLIALPANFAAWIAAPNLGTMRPYHSGSHPLYSAHADAALVRIAASRATGPVLRALLLTEESLLKTYVVSVARQGRLR